MKIYKITTYIILLFTLLSITGCGGRSEYRRLVALEKVLEKNPDSVRSVLCAMPTPEKLVVSISTTKAHVHNILQKLYVENRTQATIQAVKEGLV